MITHDFTVQTKELIDNLKGVCTSYGLGNDGNEFKIKNKLLNHCWRLWNSCVITWDGKIVPCCFDKDGTYRLGDLNDMSFEQIWKGPAYHQFRKQIIKGRQYIDICKNCSEGTSVWKN